MADNDTPRADAAAAMAAEVKTLMSSEHVAEFNALQMQILGRLQDSTAVLSHFNDFSGRSFTAVVNDFSRNTRLLRGMKNDLDHIFRRIRVLKEKLKKHHPQAFAETVKSSLDDQRPDLESET